MKKSSLIFILLFQQMVCKVWGQTIPFGTSVDSLTITTPNNTFLFEGKYGIHYYKPLTYNSSTSPILIYIHGLGGSGASSSDLQSIADRQNALIVAPTMHNGNFGYAYATENLYNSFTDCLETYWCTQVMKSIYRHAIARESRSTADVYFTGFSAGGQYVTRYLIIRQFMPDSIPMKMSVSVNPANYTLMTDTFNSAPMDWEVYRCGLGGSMMLINGCYQATSPPVKNIICNEHVKQYYNENYGVLIGTGDTQPFASFCWIAAGVNRYDRAMKFYAFSLSNAITRGTTLKWRMDSVVGVGHDQNLMYNTKRNITDTFTIAERLLFKTPFHTVQQFSPYCPTVGVGINEYSNENNFLEIYPNPSTGDFFIVSKQKAKISVSDLLGKEILNKEISIGNNKIALSAEANGVYFLRVVDNISFRVYKIIVEH